MQGASDQMLNEAVEYQVVYFCSYQASKKMISYHWKQNIYMILENRHQESFGTIIMIEYQIESAKHTLSSTGIPIIATLIQKYYFNE